MSLRAQNTVFAFALQADDDTPAAPDAAQHAILCENFQSPDDVQSTDTNEYTGGLDREAPVQGGRRGRLTFEVYVKGSGTAGQPPEVHNLLQTCGFQPVITAVAVGPVAAVGGGSADRIAAVGTFQQIDDLYRGMPILIARGAVEVTAIVAGYIGATRTFVLAAPLPFVPDGSEAVTLLPNVLYRPASVGIPSGTAHRWLDGTLHRFTGARGTVKLSLPTGGPGKFSFELSARGREKSDAPLPAAAYQPSRPAAFRDGVMRMNGGKVAISEFSWDCGTELVYPPDPNEREGSRTAQITSRAMTGSFDPEDTLVATRNLIADIDTATPKVILAAFGPYDGNRFAILIPQAQINQAVPGERDRIATEEIEFSCRGRDAGAFLCFY